MKKTNPKTTGHHPPTEAQIHANRQNAAKSTGPKTAEGKAASSRNGLTHGLAANTHILPTEDPEDFLLLLKDLYDRFHPLGLGEEKLVQRIAAEQWRLDRTFAIEAGIYRNRMQEVAEEDADRRRSYDSLAEFAEQQNHPVPPPPAPLDERDVLARAFDADAVAPGSLARLARYETTMECSIDRCLRQLKLFQAARNTPAPGPQPRLASVAASPQPPEIKPEPAPDSTPAPPNAIENGANPKNESTPPETAPSAQEIDSTTNPLSDQSGELC